MATPSTLPEKIRLPKFLRGSLALDLLPLWLALILLGSFIWVKRASGIWISTTDIALWGIVAAAGTAWLTGIWTLVRLSPMIGMITQKGLREEFALTAITAEEFLEQTLRRRLEEMKWPLVIAIPAAGSCIGLAHSELDHDFDDLGGVYMAAFIFILTAIFLVRAPVWAVASILLRLCRGSSGAARRLRLITLWIVGLVLIPFAMVPASFLALRWIYGFARMEDLFYMLRPHYDTGPVILAHYIICTPFFVLTGLALFHLRYRAFPSSIPRRLRAFLWVLLPYEVAIVFSLMANDPDPIAFTLVVVPLCAFWCMFVRLVVRRSRSTWTAAVDQYFRFG